MQFLWKESERPWEGMLQLGHHEFDTMVSSVAYTPQGGDEGVEVK